MAATDSNILASLCYRDTSAAIDWLIQAFSFEEKHTSCDGNGTTIHAELKLDNALVMIGQHGEYSTRGLEDHFWSFGTYNPTE